MPGSLKCKLKNLRHKGFISEAEYDTYISKIDGHDSFVKKEATLSTIRYLVENGYLNCNKCNIKPCNKETCISRLYEIVLANIDKEE